MSEREFEIQLGNAVIVGFIVMLVVGIALEFLSLAALFKYVFLS